MQAANWCIARRSRVALAAILSWLIASAPSQAAAEERDRPSVVLVLVDDLGWTDLSCQGSEYYETPNIDRLASQGMRFTDAYAACAVCSPTRSSVMTGRYPARVGITDWIRARFQRGGLGTPEKNPTEYVGGKNRRLLCPPNPYWMEHSELTIAELLGPAGYTSCHIGKWHLGDPDWYPQHQGFDINIGGCDYGQPPSYFDPYRNQRLPQGIPYLPPRKEGEYLTDREADEAATFIREHRDRPFFLYLAHYAVHTPIQAKESLVARYRAKPRTNQNNATYAAMVHSVDDAMGRLLAVLDETGLAETTLVIFTSDNGGLLGPTHNAPLRSGKGYPYEGGIRVPLIIRWPGVVKPGSVSHEPVISPDYLPTILEAAGVEKPAGVEIDGRSLVAHLRSGGTQPLERDAIYWHFPHYRGRDVTPYSIVRAGDWKLIQYHEGPRHELFHLREDLSEKQDRAAAEPEKVKALSAMLEEHLTRVGARMPRPNPAHPANSRPEEPASDTPRVLILGDSISIGYTPFVQELMAGEAEVVRPMRNERQAENCAGTTHGVQNVERWLEIGGGDWDVIHFNFGLHDLKRVDPRTGAPSADPEHPRQASPEKYREQLTAITDKLTKSGAKLIFATTTPVPEGRVRPHRDVEDVSRYNEIAREIMEEKGVAIDDLYAFALPRLEDIQRPVNVHFTREGSKALAEQVAKHVREALASRQEAKP